MPGTTGFCSLVLERDVGPSGGPPAATLPRQWPDAPPEGKGRARGGVLARGEGGRSGRSRAGPRAPRPRCGLWDLGHAPEPLCASVPSGVDGVTVRVAVPRGEPDATPPQADVPRAGARGGPRGGQLRSRSGRTFSPRGLADLRGGTSPRSARRPCPAQLPGPRLGAQGQVCFPGPAVLLRRWTSRKGWPSVAPAEPEDRAGRPGQATRTGARAGARRCVCLRRHRRHIRGGCFAISEKRFLPLQEGSGPGCRYFSENAGTGLYSCCCTPGAPREPWFLPTWPCVAAPVGALDAAASGPAFPAGTFHLQTGREDWASVGPRRGVGEDKRVVWPGTAGPWTVEVPHWPVRWVWAEGVLSLTVDSADGGEGPWAWREPCGQVGPLGPSWTLQTGLRTLASLPRGRGGSCVRKPWAHARLPEGLVAGRGLGADRPLCQAPRHGLRTSHSLCSDGRPAGYGGTSNPGRGLGTGVL